LRDDEMGEVDELAGAMPASDARERIHAQYQGEWLRAALRAQFLERQDRVGRTRAPQLAIVDEEAIVVGHGRSQHREARLRVRRRRSAMRRVARRKETDGLEP